MVQLVNGLRHKGVQISKCTEEKRKYKRLMDELKDVQYCSDIEALVKKFQRDPTDFEHYCAHIFRSKGFEAEVTSSLARWRIRYRAYECCRRNSDSRVQVLPTC